MSAVADRPMREIRPGDCALLLELASDAVDACQGKYPELWRSQRTFAARQNAVLTADKGRPVWEQNILTALMSPAYDSAFAAFATAAARRRCVVVLLAVQQQRRGQGDAATLNDLVPRYLAEVPSDPFTGESLRMRRDGGRLIIYSAGVNEQDDGGQVDLTQPGLPLDVGVAVPPYRETGESPQPDAEK
jgi:hypothetical protein